MLNRFCDPNLVNLVSQLEEAKFARLFRFMANLPQIEDNLAIPAMPHGLSRTELLVRMLGSVSSLNSWAVSWVFQSAYLPVGLWTERMALSQLKRRLTLAQIDLDSHADSASILYAANHMRNDIKQYPIATDAFYYLATNFAEPLSENTLDELAVHFRARFGDRSGPSGTRISFGVYTPGSIAENSGDDVRRFLIELLNMPSSYYFVAREGRISIVPATEHGWYLLNGGAAARAGVATSSLPPITVPGLLDFEWLLNARSTSEADIQAFLTEQPHFLFALDERYCQIRPHVALSSPGGAKLVPDFLIRLEDSSRWHMIELKKPSAPIMTKRGEAHKAARAAAHAVRQLLDYTDAVSTSSGRSALAQAYDCSPYEPCLVVVLGRGTPRSRFRWQSTSKGLPDVQLVTYDFLLERARRSANLIRTPGLKAL